MERNKEMQTFAARIHTFHTEHQLSKRRASSQQSKKKGGAHVLHWPHETPSGEELARAGFFYRPAIDSTDNVQCFHCSVKLDGWEASDDALKEHLAHSASCGWALSLSAGRSAQQAQQDGDEAALWRQRDPMAAELLAARRQTFEANGTVWPHESKKGWKCKVTKMIEAGWCFDPAPASSAEDDEEQDGVTCFYCNLSLDGWEPKDDPFQEHTRRSPDCAFFTLVNTSGSGADKKGKGRGKKGAARTSTASKSSRVSTQSAVSQFSEAPSLADIGALPIEDVDVEPAAVDDSIITTASQATTTGTGKGKKGKGGRAKAPAKGAKGRKRAGTVESQVEVPSYPDLSSQVQTRAAEEDDELITSQPPPADEPAPAPAPAKKTRKGAVRGSKPPQIDSSVVEISSFDLASQPTTKAKRGRKPKAKAESAHEPDSEPADLDDSEVSAQLQEELERSLSIDMDAQFEIEEQKTAQPEKPKRGVKRTSDGLKKQQPPTEESDMSATVMEFPVPPKAAAPAAKGKKGRKPSKQVEAEPMSQQIPARQEDISISDAEAAKGKKAPAYKAKGKAKKASSARSSRATTTGQEHPDPEEEDLERDERAIEAELARIAAEQAKMDDEHDRAAEFEPSPSAGRKAEPKVLEPVPASSPAASRAPSPAGSDKENDPSQTSPVKPPSAPAYVLTSPTRLPLAPGTPNRTRFSPTKPLSRLTSTTPWSPIDLDAVLLASPQPTPRTLAQRLAGGIGALSAPERNLTVEEWVRFQARRAEEELRGKCEGLVGAFEREGVRALGVLEGVRVVG